MKLLKLREGRWAWMVRTPWGIGAAYGEASSRMQALKDALLTAAEFWPIAAV